MPTALWFSLLSLVYVAGMSAYHGFFLVTRFVLPEPREREAPGWRCVRLELLLTLMVLAPLLRRILPVLPGVKAATSPALAALYVLVFAWLPLLKCVPLFLRPSLRKFNALAVLYSPPVTGLYVLGVGYLLAVTALMMVLR